MTPLTYLGIGVFILWASFVVIYTQDEDTHEFHLRPWAKQVLKWLKGRK